MKIINHHFILVLCGSVVGAYAQNTAFTYQGWLNDNGGPANGSYDLTMALFNVPSSGSALAGPRTNSAVAVSNGLFTVLLDFGGSVFDGNPYFLEIGVRTAGGGNFTMLSPRQPITPAPYAIFANTAANARNITGGSVTRLNNLSNNVTLAAGQNVTITPGGNTLTIGASAVNPWSLNGSNTFYNNGRVGIGTATPHDASLHVVAPAGGLAPGEGIRVQGQDRFPATLAYVSFVDSTEARMGYVGDGSAGDNSIFLNSDRGEVVLSTPAGRVLTATLSGNVGIGTSSAQSKLDVRGDIRLGSSSQLRAPGGEENLRIIRGVVNGAGGILAGTGFTVTHGPAGGGQYTVTFTTPFTSAPTVTATADLDGRIISTVGVTSSLANFQVRFLPSGVTDAAFHFIALGPR